MFTILFITAFICVCIGLYITVEMALFADSLFERLVWCTVVCGILLVYFIYLSEVG